MNRLKRLPIFHLALVAVLVTFATVGGCGLQQSEKAIPPEIAEEAAPPPSAPMERMDAAATEGADIAATGDTESAMAMIAAAEAAGDRKVIKTAEVDLEVENLDEAQKSVLDSVDRAGGFISSLTVNDYDTSRQAQIVARVPSAQFRVVYDAVKALGKVERDHLGGQDVTEEYMDLERRIANLQAQEQRVREMFNEADTVEELLQVEQRLTEVRGQIEGHQGRLRYLKDQVGYSTLTLSLHEYGEAPVQETAGWRILYHLRGAWRGLVGAVQWIVTALIYIVITGAVVWVPLLIVIALIRRWVGRRRAARQPAPPQ